MPRQAVFDPNRLDDDLDELLPPPSVLTVVDAPPPPQPADEVLEVPAAEPPPDPDRHDAATPARRTPAEPPEPARAPAVEGKSTARRPRGSGGRPTSSEVPIAGPAYVAVASRIPIGLWEQAQDVLFSGRERPSYAQLISWTCQDHPDEVVDRIAANAAPERTPRGRRVAQAVSTVTLRFRQDELAAFDELLATAASEGVKVTRTAGIIAVLQVAVEAAATAVGD